MSARRHPERDTRHGRTMDIQIQRDETGALSKVSHRSRYVAKGFTQIKNVHYFESFAPVASFVTLRLVFALTALPHFHVNHYDVSVHPIALTTLPSSSWSHTSTTTSSLPTAKLCANSLQPTATNAFASTTKDPFYAIRPRSNHRSRQRLTRAVHQQAPDTLAYAGLQSH